MGSVRVDYGGEELEHATVESSGGGGEESGTVEATDNFFRLHIISKEFARFFLSFSFYCNICILEISIGKILILIPILSVLLSSL